jgi:hypothetical protein
MSEELDGHRVRPLKIVHHDDRWLEPRHGSKHIAVDLEELDPLLDGCETHVGGASELRVTKQEGESIEVDELLGRMTNFLEERERSPKKLDQRRQWRRSSTAPPLEHHCTIEPHPPTEVGHQPALPHPFGTTDEDEPFSMLRRILVCVSKHGQLPSSPHAVVVRFFSCNR